MKLLLVVQREGGGVWVTECADEYTLDEHNGTPDFIQKALDVDPPNTRLMWVELPEGSLEQAFKIRSVEGTVYL